MTPAVVKQSRFEFGDIGVLPNVQPYVRSVQPGGAADSAVIVTRTGPLELSMRAERGFLRSPLERLYRAEPASLSTRGRVELAQLTADVTVSLADGHPRVVRFALQGRLSDYAFVCWRDGRFQSCTLPAAGQQLHLPADDLGRVLFATPAEVEPKSARGVKP